MIEIILLLFVIPKIIKPLAKAKGQSSTKWIFISIVVYFLIEIFVIAIYFLTFELLRQIYGWEINAESYWLTTIIYFIALFCGLLGVELVRRYLASDANPILTEPPPPPMF